MSREYIPLGIARFKVKKGRYIEGYIHIKNVVDKLGVKPGGKKLVKLYIEDIGVLEVRSSLTQKYLEFSLPKEYHSRVELGREYKAYLISIEPLEEVLERNVIIYSGGRKARVEIPKWYLEGRSILGESIVELTVEYNGLHRKLYTRYKGSGPLIQSLPPAEKYPEKIYLHNIREYRISDFIRDYNEMREKYREYRNIRLKYRKDRIYIIIDDHETEVGEYLYSAYAYYTYLLLRIYGRNGFKTLRIHNYGDKIEIYYIQHSKKQKLTAHAAYMPLKRIAYAAGTITIQYYDPRKKKISTTYLEIAGDIVNDPYIDEILSEEYGEVNKIILKLHKGRWIEAIRRITKKRKIYYSGLRKTGYHHNIGDIGEKIFQEYLIKKGYKIIKKNTWSGEHGPDIIIEKNGKRWVVEVKTVTYPAYILPALRKAFKDCFDRRRSSLYSGLETIGAAVYLSFREPICRILFKEYSNSPPPFYKTYYNLTYSLVMGYE